MALACLVVVPAASPNLASGAPIAPTATTSAATDIAVDGATLHGTVNPEGAPGATTYHFEWGADTGYGNVTDEVEAYPGDGTTDGTQDIAALQGVGGLPPNSTYHFRLVASNQEVTVRGADESFTTAPAAPAVDVLPASGDGIANPDGLLAFATSIGGTTATLNASVDPRGSPTHFHFNYGVTDAYGGSTPDGDAGSAAADGIVTAALAGLQPGTTYHFQIVANNGTGGDVTGTDRTFRTAADGTVATDVSSSQATLRSTANRGEQANSGGFPVPCLGPSNYRFEYGLDSNYGQSTHPVGLLTRTTETPAATVLSGLKPETTYHFRFVSVFGGQFLTYGCEPFVEPSVTASEDGTFTTAATPEVRLSRVTDVVVDAARLHGTIDVKGVPGATYNFSVRSTTGAAALLTQTALVPAGGGPVDVTASLAGLQPATTYQARLNATVGETTSSEIFEFTTAALTWTPRTTTPDDPAGYLRCPPACPTQPPAVQPTPRLKAPSISAKVKGAVATLRLGLPAAGTARVTGSGVKTMSTATVRAATKVVRVTLTDAGKRRLRRAKSRKLKITLAVRFADTSGATSTATKTVTFQRGSNA